MKKIYLICLIAVLLMRFSAYAGDNIKIVSLSPNLTKMLYLLEAQRSIAGCTSYCFIAKEDNREIIASAVDVNIEKVYLLKPDIVLAAVITKQPTIEALKALGLNLRVFPKPESFDDICCQFTEIAQLTGKEVLAKSIVNRQKKRLDDLKRLIPEGKSPKIFLEIGAKPLFAALPGTFMDHYIKRAGGSNIAFDLTSGTITRESVLLRNPDVIIVVTMGIAGAEEIRTWSSYKNLNAAKNKKIFTIEADMACSPTPADFVDVVEEMIKRIY